MTDPEKPKRRIRYKGSHPRHFAEKYKELSPDRYPEDYLKICASGKTPAGSHRPILLNEVLSILQPQPGDTIVDCTLGYGGHTEQLWKAVQPGGFLLALDVDPLELPKTESRLRKLPFPPESLAIRRTNFAACPNVLQEFNIKGANGLLADLGVSSMQIDNPERGFTFKAQGPLDLRMNPQKGIPASQMLTSLSKTELEQILREYSDEPLAEPIAKLLSSTPIHTTSELRDRIRTHRLADDDTVRRVFQALRIAVNDEFGALDTFLNRLPSCLKPGARAAVLTFHSGEDRRVKKAFRNGLQSGVYSCINEEVIRPTPSEQRENPRSKSAKLRWAEKTNPNKNE
jgi:16S rRNA (cytosine1402-N4)-methyltransferase